MKLSNLVNPQGTEYNHSEPGAGHLGSASSAKSRSML